MLDLTVSVALDEIIHKSFTFPVVCIYVLFPYFSSNLDYFMDYICFNIFKENMYLFFLNV